MQVKIYNRHGNVIKVINDRDLDPGSYTFTWYGKNEQDKDVASGTYDVVLDLCGKKRLVKVAVIR